MAIWQSQDGALHDDGEGAALSLSSWPQGMTQLTDVEIAAWEAARAPNPKVAIQAQMDTLDPSPQFRPLREFALAVAVQQATAAGMTEPQLYAANKGYAKMKDLEDAIQALRTQYAALP